MKASATEQQSWTRNHEYSQNWFAVSGLENHKTIFTDTQGDATANNRSRRLPQAVSANHSSSSKLHG